MESSSKPFTIEKGWLWSTGSYKDMVKNWWLEDEQCKFRIYGVCEGPPVISADVYCMPPIYNGMYSLYKEKKHIIL